MQLHPYVTQVQVQLTAAAALGDEQTRAVAGALSAAAEPAIRLALLGAASAAADEITAALLDSPGAPAVAVRIDGDELRIEVRPGEPAEPEPARPTAEEDNSARISLRLSEALKGRVEDAARAMAGALPAGADGADPVIRRSEHADFQADGVLGARHACCRANPRELAAVVGSRPPTSIASPRASRRSGLHQPPARPRASLTGRVGRCAAIRRLGRPAGGHAGTAR